MTQMPDTRFPNTVECSRVGKLVDDFITKKGNGLGLKKIFEKGAAAIENAKTQFQQWLQVEGHEAPTSVRFDAAQIQILNRGNSFERYIVINSKTARRICIAVGTEPIAKEDEDPTYTTIKSSNNDRAIRVQIVRSKDVPENTLCISRALGTMGDHLPLDDGLEFSSIFSNEEAVSTVRKLDYGHQEP